MEHNMGGSVGAAALLIFAILAAFNAIDFNSILIAMIILFVIASYIEDHQ